MYSYVNNCQTQHSDAISWKQTKQLRIQKISLNTAMQEKSSASAQVFFDTNQTGAF